MSECGREKEMLLAETGELSSRRLERLERHLAECETCRDDRVRMQSIVADAGHALSNREPSRAVITRIESLAADRPAPRFLAFPVPVVRTLAYAAILALLLGGWFVAASARRDSRIGSLSDALAIVAEPSAENGSSSDAESLQALARDLLQWEGFADDPNGCDLLNSLGEPTPTASQRHSSPGRA